MPLNTPDSVSAAKSAPRVLAKITFDRPAKDQSPDAFGNLASGAQGVPRLADADRGSLVTDDVGDDLSGVGIACSSEYFLG
jgi:hypothetical protein